MDGLDEMTLFDVYGLGECDVFVEAALIGIGVVGFDEDGVAGKAVL
jgi:hypothetical protein